VAEKKAGHVVKEVSRETVSPSKVMR